jgi:hypothetical protein
MTVWIYVNTSKQVGDPEHFKVFANADAAEKWFGENDPEGVAFEYLVLENERGRQLETASDLYLGDANLTADAIKNAAVFWV